MARVISITAGESDLEQAQIDEKCTEFDVMDQAHRRDLCVVSGEFRAFNSTRKAAALRSIAAYLQENVDNEVGVSSADAAEMLGMTRCPHDSNLDHARKQLAALVIAGSLTRKRGVGWYYTAKSLQKYLRQLADQLEHVPTLPCRSGRSNAGHWEIAR